MTRTKDIAMQMREEELLDEISRQKQTIFNLNLFNHVGKRKFRKTL